MFSNQTGVYHLNDDKNLWIKYKFAFGIGTAASSNEPTKVLYGNEKMLWYNAQKKTMLLFNPFHSYSQLDESIPLEIGNLVDYTVDWNNYMIYWTDDVFRCIRAINLYGFIQTTLFENVKKPSLIAHSTVGP